VGKWGRGTKIGSHQKHSNRKTKKKSAAAERKFYATRIPKNAKIGAAKIKVKGRERWALVRRSGRGPCENSHEIVVLCVVGGLINHPLGFERASTAGSHFEGASFRPT